MDAGTRLLGVAFGAGKLVEVKNDQGRTARPGPFEFSWALVDDLRTLPLGQIAAGIPHIGELPLL